MLEFDYITRVERELEFKTPMTREQCVSIITEAGLCKTGKVKGICNQHGFSLWTDNILRYSFNGSFSPSPDGATIIRGIFQFNDTYYRFRKVLFILIIVLMLLAYMPLLISVYTHGPLDNFAKLFFAMLLCVAIDMAVPIIFRNYERYVIDFIQNELMGIEASSAD